MASSGRGALIVIEGLDRAGKSSQCELLFEHLKSNGHKVKRMRFPDRSTTIGKSIDAYLKGEVAQENHVIHLLFSANRWEAAGQMRADIEAGVTVIIDRYYYSGIVYSAAKDHADLDLQWAREPDVGLPRPDLCLFLDIAPEIAMQRGGFGSEKYETTRMQLRVRELFHELLEGLDGEDMVLVDASRSLDDVQQNLRTRLEQLYQSRKLQQPLRKILRWS